MKIFSKKIRKILDAQILKQNKLLKSKIRAMNKLMTQYPNLYQRHFGLNFKLQYKKETEFSKRVFSTSAKK